MKSLIGITAAAAMILCTGCSVGTPHYEEKIGSVIGAYYDFSDFDIIDWTDTDPDAGIGIFPVLDEIYSPLIGDRKAEFDDLRKKYKDTGYDGAIDYIMAFSGPVAPACSIAGITIVCDCDFNAEYPTGSNIGRLVEVRYKSIREFIASGYTSGQMYAEYVRKLSDMTETDFYMIGNGQLFYNPYRTNLLTLRLTEQPDDTVSLTIAITFADSRVIRKTFEYTPL